jgi:hypothetical protein
LQSDLKNTVGFKDERRINHIFNVLEMNNDEIELLLCTEDNTDEEKGIKTLWIDAESYTGMPLLESLKRRTEVYQLLQCTGVVWPSMNDSPIEIIFRSVYNVLLRGILISCPCLIIANLVFFLVESKSWMYSLSNISNWGLDIIFIIQACALLFSLFAINKRLMTISSELELSYYPASMKFCKYFFALSLFPSLLYPVYHIILLFPDSDISHNYGSTGSMGSVGETVQTAVYVLLPFCELVVAALLSAHMLFILVDAQTLAANYAELLATLGDHKNRKKENNGGTAVTTGTTTTTNNKY